ncbi:MAG: hypothetical protein CL973_00780 [Euryarchaeota archaeon]|nr:hypothetical protein [Euryarchaeota archaeon]
MELGAIVSAVSTATSMINKVASTTNDISSISGFLTSLGSAQVDLQTLSNSGKLTEKDAIQAALTKKQIDETMKEIKDLFTISGNGALYADAMQELANARKRRLDEVRRKQKERKELMSMIKLGAIAIGVAIFLVPLLLTFIISIIKG